MAESVVGFLLQKLSSILEEEVKLLSGIREEVVYVKDELERMRAFLRVADAAEDDDVEIKMWVKQVREVAYDTEDIIDDFLYRFEHRRRHGFYGYLCKVARTIKNMKARRRIAYELQSIKTRVSNISEGRKRYDYKFNTREIGSSSGTTAGITQSWFSGLRSDARLLDEAQLVGIQSRKQDLISGLFEDDSRLRVVAVVGMGGLGKTTLVSKVYEDLEVKTHFQHHAWVTVSQSFNPDDLLRQIIKQLFEKINQPLPEDAKSTDSHTLKTIIQEFLRPKRYLIVLDDIWGVEQWIALKNAFPDNNEGSRLIIASRNAEVATSSISDLRGAIHPLRPLSDEDSWSLFCATTFQGNPCPHRLEIISQNILEKCEGLPLAIVAISGMLATKDINRIDEWDMVDRSIRAELESNKKLKGMQEILSLSFNDLPYNLKYCFMFLHIFPEDYLIKRNKIIRLWIAEGFVEENEGRTPEEEGERCFNELLNRSLIQVGERYKDGRIKSCRVHDLLREIIILKSKYHRFAAITNVEEYKALLERVRHLSVHEGTKIDARGDKNLSRLRSFLYLGKENEDPDNFMFQNFYHGLRLLKVMDFTGAPLSIFPEEITKLYHLRYLCLRNTNVRTIPRSIRNLRNLETFDLKNTFVRELPSEILQLHRLRHLIVYRYSFRSSSGMGHGFKALEGIETLSSLRKLAGIEANQCGSDLLVSVGRLTQLTRLGLLRLGEEHGNALCSAIDKLTHLRSLSLKTREEDEIIILQFLSSPPLFLQRLYLRGRLEILPHWLPNLESLANLRFEFSRFQVNPLDSLLSLTNLVSLGFHRRAYDGEALHFKAGAFPKLRNFELEQANNLRRVTVEAGAMPHLENLRLADCKSLKEIPSGVEHLKYLKEFRLVNMAKELTLTLYRGSPDENYLKVRHIPFVYIGQRTDEGLLGRIL